MRRLGAVLAFGVICLLLGPGAAQAQNALTAPTISSVTASTGTLIGTLTVSWTAPASDGGAAVTAYEMRFIRTGASDKADANWDLRQGFWSSGDPLEHTLERLDDGVSYDVQVRAVNRNGEGPWSATFVGSTPDHGGTFATATPIELGPRNVRAGHISTTTDEDYFQITLEADTYIIAESRVDGSLSLTPTAYDSTQVEMDMYVIPHEAFPATLPGLGFQMFGKLSAGTSYIRIAASSEATGAYAFTVVEDAELTSLINKCTALTTSQSDPLYGCQWHLSNTGQFPGGAGMDINVESVWAGGNKGEGINVAVIDYGLDTDHEDLVDNVIASRNYVVGSGDANPRDDVLYHFETHGTNVAGLIAARDNDIGMRGVAPRANIYAYSRNEQIFTEDDLAAAMIRDLADTAVSNNSWVWHGYLHLPRRPPAIWEMAVERGVTEGFDNKGIFYVFGAGNGYLSLQQSNFNGAANYFAVTTACAVDYTDRRSSYSETGVNLWICAPSSASVSGLLPQIATTTVGSRYVDDFGGTSAATPIVSGVAALVRAADTDLTWRDVKLILAASARMNDPSNTNWVAGALEYGSTTKRYSYNHEYGFGVVDAAAAVALASNWTKLPSLRKITRTGTGDTVTIPDAAMDETPGATITRSVTIDANEVDFVEFVAIEMTLDHPAIRDLDITLESPNGDTSALSTYNPHPQSLPFDGNHRFGSARHLGEDAAGEWKIHLVDNNHESEGELEAWTLTVYGHGLYPGDLKNTGVTPGPRSLTVAWDAPDDTGSSAVTGYDLRFIATDATDKSDDEWTQEEVSATTDTVEHTLEGLDPLVEYDIQVRAVNDNGAGPWTATSSGTTQAGPPDAPAITTTTSGTRQVTLGWTAPGSDGGSAITKYQYRHSTDAGVTWNPDWTDIPDGDDTDTDPANETSHTLTGLTGGVVHTFELRAVNAKGASAPAQTTATPVSAPGAPTGLDADPDDRSARLSWTAPGSDGGSAITKYQYRHSTDAGVTWNPDWTDVPDGDDTDTDPANETSHTLTGLTNGTTYTIQLRAVNSIGGSGHTQTTTTPATEPGTPTGFNAASGTRQVTLGWTAPGSDGGSAITKYQYRHSTDAGVTWNPDWTDIPDGDDTDTDPANETSHTLTGLTNGTTYTIQLRAVNSIGGSGHTQTTTTLATPPDPPSTFKAARGERSAVLLWNEPGSDGNSAITKYQYRHSTDAGVTWNPDWTDVPDGDDTDTDPANETSHTLTGLTNGTTYTIQLRAVNNIGESQAAQATATPVSPKRGTALVATYDEAHTQPDVPVIIALLTNDASPQQEQLWITAVSDPPNGTATRNADSTLVKYEPDAGFIGTDNFTYTFTDGTQSSTAAVSVEVAPTNPPETGQPTWEVRLSATEVAEGDLITLSAINTNQDATLPSDHKFWVTIHIGRTESTADQDDFQVEDSSGAVSKSLDITATKHHNGGWLYAVRTTAGKTTDFARIRFSKNNDGPHTERLALWVYVDGTLAGSEAIAILSGE